MNLAEIKHVILLTRIMKILADIKCKKGSLKNLDNVGKAKEEEKRKSNQQDDHYCYKNRGPSC